MDPKEIVAEMALLLADLRMNEAQQATLAEERRDLDRKIEDLAGKYSANTDFVVTVGGSACLIKMLDAAVISIERVDLFETLIHSDLKTER